MKKCHVDGCDRNADRVWMEDRSKRICETHLKRWEKTGKFSIDRPIGWGEEVNRKYKEKECVYCKQTKKIAAKDLCRACYQRQKKTGNLEYQRKGIINTCKIDDCNNNVMSNGLCDKHRTNLKRNGSAESTRPLDWGDRQKHPLYHYWSDTKRRQTLNICSDWVEDFWSFVDCVGERPSKNHYLRSVNIEDVLGPDNWQWVKGITNATRQMVNREKRKNHDKNKLRLSAEERKAILLKAGNKCQMCGVSYNDNDCPTTGMQSPKTLCIDHCHETGKVRGVLCRACNSGLGHLKDDISLLERAIVYLTST